MLNVQEWLNKFDIDDLIMTYFTEFPCQYGSMDDRTLSLQEIDRADDRDFSDYVMRLKRVKPVSNDFGYIFYGCNRFENGYSNITVELSCEKDIYAGESPEYNTWADNEFSEVMGYFVADTEFTTKNIKVVLAHILHQLASHGYNQEKKKTRQELNTFFLENATTILREFRINEALSHTPGSDEYGFMNDVSSDSELDEKYSAILNAIDEYNKYCRNKEIKQIWPNFDIPHG